LDYLIAEIKSKEDFFLYELLASYKHEFLRLINTPIGLSVTEKLNNMHAYDTMASESSLEMGALQQAILSIDLYLKVEQKIVVNTG